VMVGIVNASVESADEQAERERLVAKYGEVWNTEELQKEFEPMHFMAPFVIVVRKSDNVKGSVMFQHSPRFYFQFEKA
jgi:hypothetical protein